MLGIEMTRRQRLVLIGLCFLASVVLYVVYPYVMPRTDGSDALVITTALICIAGFVSVISQNDE